MGLYDILYIMFKIVHSCIREKRNYPYQIEEWADYSRKLPNVATVVTQ